MPQPKKSKIAEYAEAVQVQQKTALDARDEMGQELLDHMMQLPSIAATFTNEEDKAAFSSQLVFFMDGVLRGQQERQRQREANAAAAEKQAKQA
jgi:hypothetical protein